MEILTTSEVIAKAVEEGFAQQPKRLPSWLFYDEAGDKIFQQIMHMPEYYLTQCEYDILAANKMDMLKRFQTDGAFQLIELGAGDGLKTEILLQHFIEQGADFSYHPIDISATALEDLKQRLTTSLPDLNIKPQQGEYLEALNTLSLSSSVRKVILFLGSNIGNFTLPDAGALLKNICSYMHSGDILITGVDLKKNPRMIQVAYDDPHGITKAFNLNLLIRLNKELGARFVIDQFRHYALYDPETGEARSYLISLRDQEVYIDALEKSIFFNRWEYIQTEVSVKYDQAMIDQLAKASGLSIEHSYYDDKQYFADVVFVK